MKGIIQRIDGDKLILEVDLTQNFGDSSTGKSIVVATSGGHAKIEDRPGLSYSLNVNLSKRALKAAGAPAPAAKAEPRDPDAIEYI